LNNLAFSQASTGRVTEAVDTMGRLAEPEDPVKRLIWIATRGLLAFRLGDTEKGRRLYQESIMGWQRQDGRRDNAARAAVFWAREETLAGTEEADGAVAVADALCARFADNSEIELLHRRLKSSFAKHRS
jgi:hypothetical protein